MLCGSSEGLGLGVVHLEEKLVSVMLEAFGRAFPTLSFGFTKSAFLFALFRADEPMAATDRGQGIFLMRGTLLWLVSLWNLMVAFESTGNPDISPSLRDVS